MYNGVFGDGSRSYGGYSERVRAAGALCRQDPRCAERCPAPMHHGVCAAEEERGRAGSGTRVGIVGMGGLGHFGLLFARARSGVRVGRGDFADRGGEAGCAGDGGRCVYCDG